MKTEMEAMVDFKQKIYKRTYWTDWVLIKLACFIFGIFLVDYCYDLVIWVEWYWWLLAAHALMAPLFIQLYILPKNKKKCKPTDMDCRYDVAKRELGFWEWGLVKWSSVLFGIAVAGYSLDVVNFLDWWVWLVIFVLLIIFPLYHILKPKQRQTTAVVRSYKPKPKAKIRRR